MDHSAGVHSYNRPSRIVSLPIGLLSYNTTGLETHCPSGFVIPDHPSDPDIEWVEGTNCAIACISPVYSRDDYEAGQHLIDFFAWLGFFMIIINILSHRVSSFRPMHYLKLYNFVFATITTFMNMVQSLFPVEKRFCRDNANGITGRDGINFCTFSAVVVIYVSISIMITWMVNVFVIFQTIVLGRTAKQMDKNKKKYLMAIFGLPVVPTLILIASGNIGYRKGGSSCFTNQVADDNNLDMWCYWVIAGVTAAISLVLLTAIMHKAISVIWFAKIDTSTRPKIPFAGAMRPESSNVSSMTGINDNEDEDDHITKQQAFGSGGGSGGDVADGFYYTTVQTMDLPKPLPLVVDVESGPSGSGSGVGISMGSGIGTADYKNGSMALVPVDISPGHVDGSRDVIDGAGNKNLAAVEGVGASAGSGRLPVTKGVASTKTTPSGSFGMASLKISSLINSIFTPISSKIVPTNSSSDQGNLSRLGGGNNSSNCAEANQNKLAHQSRGKEKCNEVAVDGEDFVVSVASRMRILASPLMFSAVYMTMVMGGLYARFSLYESYRHRWIMFSGWIQCIFETYYNTYTADLVDYSLYDDVGARQALAYRMCGVAPKSTVSPAAILWFFVCIFGYPLLVALIYMKPKFVWNLATRCATC